MDKYQYRVIVNDSIGEILDILPSNWNNIARIAEERGWKAILQRRFVTDCDILPLLTDTLGWFILRNKNLVISPWEVFAQIN